MTIPFFDMSRHLAATRPLIQDSLDHTLNSGSLILGAEVANFELEFAAFCNSSSCIALANGTDAIEIALRALGCGSGSKIITAANADMYSSCAIMAVGGTPVFAEIDPATALLTAKTIEPHIKGVDAVIVTHLYGQLAEMEAIVELAAQHNIKVVEDCAQAHGAIRQERPAGAWGDVGCFSFYPTKNLGAIGDAGAVVTSNLEIAQKIKLLRQYGWIKKYDAAIPFGRNSRMDEFQGAVLRRKLPLLDGWNARRREIHRRYQKELGGKFEFFTKSAVNDFVAHLSVLKAPDREELQKKLAEKGIDTGVHYPIPTYLQPAIAKTIGAVSLPQTERLAKSVLSLPCFPELCEAEVEYVIETLLALS